MTATTIPLQIRFLHMPRNEALESDIRARADELSKIFDRIVRCKVVVEAPSTHHRHGSHYRVQVDVSVPGRELIANRHPAEHDAHEDPRLAVRDAFRAAHRELEKYAQRQRGHAKRQAGAI